MSRKLLSSLCNTENFPFLSDTKSIRFFTVWMTFFIFIISCWAKTPLATTPISIAEFPQNEASVSGDKNDINSFAELAGLQGIDTIYLDVVSMETFDTCLSTLQLPGGFANASTVFGPVNNTGILTVNTLDSCIRFFADAGITGDFVDTMAVALCDPMMICDTFVIILSIEASPCPEYYFGPESILVDNCDTIVQLCMDGGDVSSIGALNITDNGMLYNGIVRGCNIDSFIYYINLRFDDPGDYVLLKWSVNGDTLRNSSFNTLQELVSAMNNFDPTATWIVDGVTIVGGDPDQEYGDLCIVANGIALPAEPSRLLILPNGISIELDTGFHEVIIENSRTMCLDTFSVTISCRLPFMVDTTQLDIEIGEIGNFCVDTQELAGTVLVLNDICQNGLGTYTDITFENDLRCISFEGIDVGADTFCLVFCKDLSAQICDTTILIIAVSPMPANPPVAMDDFGATVLNKRVTLNVLSNDSLNGNLINLLLITTPQSGEATINPDFTISYEPDPNTCGVIDTFAYVLITTTGRDTATITINISCDQLRIFSGFSPNQDGVNDTWQIIGIDDFPNNEVFLYNRWGNQVYVAKGYSNTMAWDGTWSGKNLPDGLYFYVVKDGEGNSYNGYVRLQR